MASQYRNLDDFLSKHKISKSEQVSPTHTRIGCAKTHISGGSYFIDEDKKQIFYELYYKKVFQEKRPEFLTEKQLDDGPILIDLDLKFSLDVDSRLYTNEHLESILGLYLDTLKTMIQFTNTPFPIFIMEKKDVNRCIEKGLTKDGIHMVIGISLDRTLQIMLRKKVIQEISKLWDEDDALPLINTWDNIIDDSISKGSTNWQLYGSRKPLHEPYILTQYYNVTFDESDKEFSMDKKTINEKDVLGLVSAQCASHPCFAMKPELQMEYDEMKNAKSVPRPKKRSCLKFNVIEDEVVPHINDIKTKEQLEAAVNAMLKSLDVNEHYIREAHEYTQILPALYYEDGSHPHNCRVGFALKHTDERLFLSWVMLRSKCSSFTYDDIPNLVYRWQHFNKREDGVTRNSIIYWAKKDSPEKYLQVKESSLQYYIDQTLLTSLSTDYDLAKLLYFMNKDSYCCTNIGSKTWYVFEQHRWREDKRMSIRNKISEEVHQLYHTKLLSMISELGQSNENQENHEKLKEKIKKITKTCEKLKRTSDKNNIFREAAEIFCNDEFSQKVDSNTHLLCFKNGVVDFNTKSFRDGLPEDYITKCTHVNYFPDIEKYMKGEGDQEIIKTVRDIEEYMRQLYPVPELCEYMWSHLASCLIGVNKNQTCSFYIGSGSNGKSSIVELMSYAFGDYKGVLPISIVTDKRASIGGTTSEIIALKGVRYAVMQESSKGMKINEGILKELTGGDTIVGRQLFKESETFTPQFTLVVCTNNLPEIDATDDGTWRRIKSIPHMAKFVDNLNDKRYSGQNYLVKKNKDMKELLKKWAPIFMSMLVYKVFQTDGNVEDCNIVAENSMKYREEQDYVSAFLNERIVLEEGSVVGITNLNQEFQAWFQENNSGKIPKMSDLKKAMTDRFGEQVKTKWRNVRLIVNSEKDLED